MKSGRLSNSSPTTKSATSSSRPSGSAAILRLIPIENEFKEEHYGRIAYANEHFRRGYSGMEDRPRPHVHHVRPSRTKSSRILRAEPMNVRWKKAAARLLPILLKTWRYRYIEGVGQEIIIEFVDTCMCGDYHMTIDRGEKDALLHVPGAGLTLYEQMGMANKAARFNDGGMETLGGGPFNQRSADQAIRPAGDSLRS